MFSKLSIKNKTLAAFLAIAGISVVSGVVGYVQTSAVEASIDEGQHLRTEVDLLNQLSERVTEQALLLKSFVLTGDRGELSQLQEKNGEVQSAIVAAESHAKGAQEKAAITDAAGSWKSWRETHLDRVVELMRQPSTIDLARLVETSGENIRHIDDFFTKIKAIKAKTANELSVAADEEVSAAATAGVTVLLASAVVFVLALVLGVVNFRIMSKMASTMRAMAEGGAGVVVEGEDRHDEIGDMARAAATFRGKLEEIEKAEQERVAAEKRAEEDRQAMLARLREEFGQVVNAAIDGDFTKRVDARFDDAVLNDLAQGVNSLVETVNAGVGETTRVAALLAEGDLTAAMKGEFRGSFAELQSSLNRSLKRLDELVGEISSDAAEMQEASGKIQQGAEDLAGRAESQASSLEETAATMEEMTATIRANAESADQARDFSGEAAGRARRGGEVVQEAVSAMSRIEESSTKISDIISVIDSIAFQTNLLALNAAVEAARAGDAGKGFAVVASEVRTLAQRSADAAKDITSLISESSHHVSSGVDLVQRTGSSLAEIVDAVEKVAGTVASISTATREQASGVDEISNAVSHMDQMTQQNAALSEQSANSARSLAERSQSLADQVSFFKTSSRSASRPSAKPQPKAPAKAGKPAAAEAVHAASESAPPHQEPALAKAAGDDWSVF